MLTLGDFNVKIDESHMKSFCETYNLTNPIKQPTCYKNCDNPTCIDLILTNDYLCNWDRAIGFSFNDIDYYEKKSLKNRGLESLIIAHLNIFPIKNLESL